MYEDAQAAVRLTAAWLKSQFKFQTLGQRSCDFGFSHPAAQGFNLNGTHSVGGIAEDEVAIVLHGSSSCRIVVCIAVAAA